MTTDEEARLERMNRVLHRAVDLFNDEDDAEMWFRTRNTFLGGKSPRLAAEAVLR